MKSVKIFSVLAFTSVTLESRCNVTAKSLTHSLKYIIADANAFKRRIYMNEIF